METYVFIILVIVSIILCFLIIFVCYSYLIKKVTKYSILYQKLLILNEKYNLLFCSNLRKDINYNKVCNSKREFDHLDLHHILVNNIEVEISSLISLYEKIMQNKLTNKKYLIEYNNLTGETTSDIIKKSKVPYKIFLRLEKKLYIKNQLQPILTVNVSVSKSYTNPAGRNKHYKSNKYNFDQFKRCIMIVKTNLEYKKTQKYQRKL